MSTQPAFSLVGDHAFPAVRREPTFATSGSNATVTFAKAGSYGISVKGTSGSVSLSRHR